MTEEMLTKALEKAKRAGASAADALFVKSTDVTVSQRLGKPEEMQRSEERGLGLRVLVGQKIATGCTSDFSDEAVEEMVGRTLAMAREGIDDPHAGMADPARLIKDVPALDLNDPDGEPDVEDLRALCVETEEIAMQDEAITNSEGAEAGFTQAEICLATSTGLAKCYSGSHSGLSVCVLGGQGEAMQRDYAYSSARYMADLRSPSALGEEARMRTLRRLNPRKVSTQSVPVVFDPRIGRRLVSSFCSAISGAVVARGTSFLKEKMGEQIFHPAITIMDDPRRLRGLGSRPFDGEGLPAEAMALVKDGVLQEWLLDVRSANQLDLKSNGRAARGLNSSPSPSNTNCYIEPGTRSPQDMMADISQGLYVTDAFGGGANIVTGDFSLGVAGLWIENAELAYPVSEVTIAGELPAMYQQLQAADDLVFDSATCVPTLRIDGMTVAGS